MVQFHCLIECIKFIIAVMWYLTLVNSRNNVLFNFVILWPGWQQVLAGPKALADFGINDGDQIQMPCRCSWQMKEHTCFGHIHAAASNHLNFTTNLPAGACYYSIFDWNPNLLSPIFPTSSMCNARNSTRSLCILAEQKARQRSMVLPPSADKGEGFYKTLSYPKYHIIFKHSRWKMKLEW